MFAQLRRVVYLLVLLQCCACVAYAESAEECAPATKMDEKLLGFNITTEQLLANGRIAFGVLDMNVKTLQKLSEDVKFVAEGTQELVENRSEPVTPGSEDASDEDTTEEMVGDVKDIIKSVADAAESVRLAIRYCKYWSDILDELIAYCGKPTGEHILSESDENLLAVEPKTTYEELYLLRAHIIAATKRGNDHVKEVRQREQAVEVALDELNVLDDTLKAEIQGIRDDAKKNSAASFEEILKEHEVETMFLEIARESGEAADPVINKDQSGEDSATTKVEPPQSEPQPRETTPESPQETSTTDGPTKETASTTKTDNGDTTTPITTTTTTAVTKTVKKKPQDAANAPMGNTAVLAVLALTVSTVIGMAVV